MEYLVGCSLVFNFSYYFGFISPILIGGLVPSVWPKPLFWFRSNTETNTQIGQYFQSIPKPHFKRKNLVTDFVMFFFHHKRAPETKFSSKHWILLNYYWRSGFIFPIFLIPNLVSVAHCLFPLDLKNIPTGLSIHFWK